MRDLHVLTVALGFSVEEGGGSQVNGEVAVAHFVGWFCSGCRRVAAMVVVDLLRSCGVWTFVSRGAVLVTRVLVNVFSFF